MPRFTPQEDAVLMAYVDRCADWKAATANLPNRSLGAARLRLTRLRRAAGTLWTIDQSEKARGQRRVGSRWV